MTAELSLAERAETARAEASRINPRLAIPEHYWHDVTGKGKPLGTLENFEIMMDAYGIVPRYNLISKQDDTLLPGLETTVDNHDEVVFANVTSLAARNGFPLGNVGPFMLALADRNATNPVLDWIKSQPWDGKDRLPELYSGITMDEGFNQELGEMLIMRWLVSAAAAAAMPSGFRNRGVLTFAGPQHIGKTSWFRNLLPASHHQYFGEGKSLDPSNKDSLIEALSFWIMELGEVDSTFRKADISKLKAFITNGEDKVRKPYARTHSNLPRRTVFCGSVNDREFLVDKTGNSRWWVIPVTRLRYEQPVEDVQQLWAQILTLYEAGVRWWLSSQEEAELAKSNANHEEVDPLEELVLSRYDIDSKKAPRERRMAATDVLVELGYDKPTRAQRRDMGKVLTKHFGKSKKSGNSRYYEMPKKRRDDAEYPDDPGEEQVF